MDKNLKPLSSISGLRELFKSMPTHNHRKGQVLIHQSDRIDHFFVIVDGYVKVYTINEEGDEVTLLILGPNDIFPLLKNPDQSETISLYYYEALTPVNVGKVGQQELLDKVKSSRQASWALLSYISEFSSTLTNRLAQLEGKRAEQKLENVFLYLINVCGEEVKPGIYRLKLKLSHQEIARLLGITRETVSREIKKLEDIGYIAHEDGYLTIDTNLKQS